MRIGNLVFALFLAVFALACDSGATPAAPTAEASPEAEAAAPVAVEVPKDGKKFKPPLQLEQVPDGAWICDMGTVHYARGEKGDGRCPLCKMNLKEHKAPK